MLEEQGSPPLAVYPTTPTLATIITGTVNTGTVASKTHSLIFSGVSVENQAMFTLGTANYIPVCIIMNGFITITEKATFPFMDTFANFSVSILHGFAGFSPYIFTDTSCCNSFAIALNSHVCLITEKTLPSGIGTGSAGIVIVHNSSFIAPEIRGFSYGFSGACNVVVNRLKKSCFFASHND